MSWIKQAMRAYVERMHTLKPDGTLKGTRPVTGLRAQVAEMGAEVERLSKIDRCQTIIEACSDCGIVMLRDKMIKTQSWCEIICIS